MKSKIILALAISLGSLSACESDSIDIEFNGVGDIYVRCQKIENETKYAPVVYAYSNMRMSEAKIYHSDEESNALLLEKVNENATTFNFLPKSEDFTTADNIVNGIYNFRLTSTDGEILELSDKLLEERIDPLEISSFGYNQDENKIDAEWGTVENRDAYHVKIATKIDGQIVYSSGRLNDNSITITPESQGWNRNYTMKSGTTYTLSVSAYKFEDSKTQNGYHINQESVDYRTLEW